jgi:hypothetical protein
MDSRVGATPWTARHAVGSATFYYAGSGHTPTTKSSKARVIVIGNAALHRVIQHR